MTTRAGSIRIRGLIGLVAGICGGGALLVAGIFTVLLISVVNLRQDDSSARRASDLLIQSSTVERSVVDLESGLRGMLLTRDTSFLGPYSQARARLPGELRALSALAETPPERYQVSNISQSIRAYIAGYAQPLIRTRGRLSDTQSVRAATQGKHLLDRLRLEFTALTNDELALRSSRAGTAKTQSNTAILIAAIGLAVSVALLIGLGIYLVRQILRPMRVVANAAGKLAAGFLTTRVPATGRGEVGMLAGAFNAMAAELQHRDEELTHTHRQLARALVQAREASEMKSNFLANMSHEIRTPLNGVVGMMDLLAETHLAAEQREYVNVARASGEALMLVVNDVLDIAKIEAGRLDLEHRYFDLHDLIEASTDMIAASSAAKGLEVQSFVHEDVPRTVRGDRMRTGQILANLLSNAVKFTAAGEVVLEVDLDSPARSRPGEPHLRVRFDVRDTGIGIPQEKVDQLFEPFTQADAGTTRAYGGTGLGLAIVRELTQMMGGIVSVRSELGHGSTFSIVIPFEVAEDGLDRPASKSELRALHVLIVDDNSTNRRIFESYTAAWGMRPALASDVPGAKLKLQQAAERDDPFDVVLLDLNMPDENGLMLARWIMAEQALEGTRVILLTSSTESGLEERAGVSYHLTKPIRQSRLFDAMSEVMSGRVAPPAEQMAANGAAEAAGETPEPSAPGDGFRVLVAEDQPVNWMLIERLLAKRGHSAVNVINGEQALEMLDREPYDLVLMDCQMPLLDGYEATRELRRREQERGRGHTTVIAMTANAMEGDRELCLSAGMDDYLPKPITSAAIDEILTRWLPHAVLEQAGAPSTLDPVRIRELRTLFPGEETAEMFDQLQREVDVQLHRLDAALEAADGTEAAEAAHRILSSARMLGAGGLVDAANQLQTVAREDLVNAAALAERVRDEWHAVSNALDAELTRGR